MEEINHVLGYPDLLIVQDPQMLRFSLDAVLLSHFVTIPAKCQSILDIGCGNAPVPLILSRRTKARIVGVEIQEAVADLAKKSVDLNHLEEQISIITGDVKEYAKEQESDQFDVIVCNPPFFPLCEETLTNVSEYKRIARHEFCLTLEDLFKSARKLLKNGGVIGIVHRPDRLVDVLSCMREHHIEPKRIQLIYPREGKEAHMLLVEGAKDGKPGLRILPPIYVHESDGSYTLALQQFFE